MAMTTPTAATALRRSQLALKASRSPGSNQNDPPDVTAVPGSLPTPPSTNRHGMRSAPPSVTTTTTMARRSPNKPGPRARRQYLTHKLINTAGQDC
jgi:hypothetical protein